VAVSCSALQCVAVYCSVLQRVAVFCSTLQFLQCLVVVLFVSTLLEENGIFLFRLTNRTEANRKKEKEERKKEGAGGGVVMRGGEVKRKEATPSYFSFESPFYVT